MDALTNDQRETGQVAAIIAALFAASARTVAYEKRTGKNAENRLSPLPLFAGRR